jgi:hypothetical protein
MMAFAVTRSSLRRTPSASPWTRKEPEGPLVGGFRGFGLLEERSSGRFRSKFEMHFILIDMACHLSVELVPTFDFRVVGSEEFGGG